MSDPLRPVYRALPSESDATRMDPETQENAPLLDRAANNRVARAAPASAGPSVTATEVETKPVPRHPLALSKQLDEEDDNAEQLPLLPAAQREQLPAEHSHKVQVTAVPLTGEPVKPAASGSASSNKETITTPMICRICLEEDTSEVLETPCGCTGTCRAAHHSCVQQWISAKGNRRCEICGQDYRGDFTVPPPAPPAPPSDVFPPGTMPPRHLRSIYITVDGLPHALYQQDETDIREQTGRTGAAWCLSFMVFLSLMFLLHHTMLLSDDATMDPNDPIYMSSPPPPNAPDPWGDQDQEDVGPGVVLFWILTRLLIIGVPIYMVMRATYLARQQAEEMAQIQAEMHRADSQWRIIVPGSAIAPGPHVPRQPAQQQMAVMV